MSQSNKESEVADTLLKAMALQQTGNFQEAGELFLGILKDQPNHAETNNRMGCLAVQMNQPVASLTYFVNALDAAPSHGQYWLNYIDALFQSGQSDEAQQVLMLAQQQGLQGDEVDALATRINRIQRTEGQHNTKSTSAATMQISNQNDIKAKPVKTNSTKKKSAKLKDATPSQQEINTLITLFTSGHLAEAAPLAQTMTERFPQHEFGWKALGAIFKQMGMSEKALLPMQKAATLAPKDVEAHYNLGVTYQELCLLNDAETSYRRALQIDPNNAKTHSNLGVLLQSLNRLDEAAASSQRALLLDPNNPKAHSNQGVILQKLGRPQVAEASYRRALELDDGNAETYCNLGNTLKDIGRADEAESSYLRALQIDSDFSDAHYNLGNLLQDLGRLQDSVASYLRALQINPYNSDAHFNLGNVYAKLMRLADAEISYKRALETSPNNVEVHFNLGNVQLVQHQLTKAELSFKRVIEVNPVHAEANYYLGVALFRLGKLGEAGVQYWRALKIRPEYAEAHCSLGELLFEWNQLQAAEESLLNALRIKPNHAEAHAILGAILTRMGRLSEAEASCQRALVIKPDYVIALCNLGNAQFDHGHLKIAEASYRLALKYQPTHQPTHSNLLFCMSHNATTDAKALFNEHIRFSEKFEIPLRGQQTRHENSRDPDRTLQIGFISADFKNHPISNFIEPVLQHLSTYPRLALHAYANHKIDDAYSQRLRGYFAHWTPTTNMNDEMLAEKIHADGIDILIDLSGHTADNRLLTLARKPAPVQASWMGYPGTTGLSSIDYYLADRYLLPAGIFDDQFTEKIIRLPAVAPFLPFDNAPPVNTLPALKNGYVTFGSFNRLSKINRESVALWSQLLNATPSARMLLGGLPQGGKYDDLINWFTQDGISRQRLDFHPRSSMDEYLSLHHQVDICLDTFPYSGATTTFHAIWMGVPTLTISGNTAVGRSSASILSHAGLEDYITNNVSEFIQRGMTLTANLNALSKVRAELRERFARSAPGRPEVIAAGLESALRTMWQRWCNDLQPASFETAVEVSGSEYQVSHL